MAEDVIEAGSFATEAEAALARGALDVEGIPARLGDAATAGWFWHWGPALRGVLVLVKQEDAKRAWDVLASRLASTGAGRESLSDGELAWRASVIGVGLFPPLLNLYSMWILVRHIIKLSEEDRELDWQGFAALMINLFTFLGAAMFLRYIIL